jgi:hypothetical protein
MPDDKPKQNVIAIVYDFDGTLSPNNIQEDTIFWEYGIDKDKFWKRTNDLVAQGYERTLAYLKLLVHDAPFQKKPLSRKRMAQWASRVEYFPGVLEYFDHIGRFVEHFSEVKKWGIQLEHYIVSSGLKEILEASVIAKHFKRIYACEYDYENDRPIFPKLVVSDTSKTQFLFRINKGKLELGEDINTHMPDTQRRVPFGNMIYVGDGNTDIPSMTVMHKNGGHTIAVFPPDGEVSGEIVSMVREGRADHFAPANFKEDKLLVKIIKLTLKKIILNIAYRSSAQMSSQWVKQHPKGRRISAKK